MVATEKQYFARQWMTSSDIPTTKHRFVDEHLPQLKTINEHAVANKQILQTQPKLRSSSLFPPVARSISSKSGLTHWSSESPSSSIVNSSTVNDVDQHSPTRNKLLSLTLVSPRLQIGNSIRPKRVSLYDHVGPKINTGLVSRTGSLIRTENDTHRLGPIRPLNWRLLRQEVERDTDIRVQAKRLQFNSGITYTTQLKTLGDLIRSKVKSHVSSMMGFIEERYKIVVHLTVFQTTTAGLYVASRCLWNSETDNSMTIKMYGVDCNILIVIFLCYTELGTL